MVVNALKTTHHEMRVTASQPLLPLFQDWKGGPGRESRPAGFARALMRRYEFQGGDWPRPALVFSPVRLEVMARHDYHQLHLAPRLDFTVVRRLIGRAERVEAVASPGALTGRRPGPDWPPAPGVPAVRRSGPDRSPAPPTGERASPWLPPPMVQPVPRVVRRPAAVTATTNHSVVDDARLPGAATLPADSSQRPAVAASVDVNHLTDQVIQAIDRRIIAHRERLGKI